MSGDEDLTAEWTPEERAASALVVADWRRGRTHPQLCVYAHQWTLGPQIRNRFFRASWGGWSVIHAWWGHEGRILLYESLPWRWVPEREEDRARMMVDLIEAGEP